MKKILTCEMLKTWNPCTEGFKRFCQLFPKGEELDKAAEKLHEDGHSDWGLWLYQKAREKGLFKEITIKGFMNTGDRNTGDWNTGDRNTGDRNTGDWNTGDRNTGHWNTGHWNTGHWNTGDWNTGHWNTGHRNTGDWNTGDQNTGFFNTINPEILVFNKPCPQEIWRSCYKPYFLSFDLTYWVDESEMTEEEKAKDPGCHYRGGQLRKKEYKTAFKESWEKANHEDRIKVKDLPNFDAQIFFEISGIDLR